MKLVIEIDHEHYERIMRIEEGVTVYPTTLALYEAVKNATPLEAQPSENCISILNRIMEYTYGMLTTEKIGLQHLIKSMMDELSGGDSE